MMPGSHLRVGGQGVGRHWASIGPERDLEVRARRN